MKCPDISDLTRSSGHVLNFRKTKREHSKRPDGIKDQLQEMVIIIGLRKPFLNLPEDPDIPLDCLGLDLQVVEVPGAAPEVQQPPHHRPLLRRFVLANCKENT